MCPRHARVEDDDEYKTSHSGAQNYYTIAHTVHETVTEQATILVNGKLKEYQVIVFSFLESCSSSEQVYL